MRIETQVEALGLATALKAWFEDTREQGHMRDIEDIEVYDPDEPEERPVARPARLVEQAA